MMSSTPGISHTFATAGARAFCRLSGMATLAETVEAIDGAIQRAIDEGLTELVVNITGLSGFAPPPLAERFAFVSRWAARAAGRVRMAMVARPEFIDPQKFGVTVAENSAMTCNVFTSDEDAGSWLGGQ